MPHSTHMGDITTAARARFAAGASIVSLLFVGFVLMILAYFGALP